MHALFGSVGLAVCLLLMPYTGQAVEIPSANWGFQTFRDELFTFVCNDTEINVQDGETITWETTDGTMLTDGHDGEMFQVEGSDGIPGMLLHIKTVTESDEGIYKCHVMVDGKVSRTALRALNLGGPAYREMSDKYNYNIMVAAISGAVLLVFLVGMCLLVSCRYQTREQRQRTKQQQNIRKRSSRKKSSTDDDKEVAAGYSDKIRYQYGSGAYQNPVMDEDSTKL